MVYGVSQIVDQQVGPTCAFEAAENLIQCFYYLDDSISERWLQPWAIQSGFGVWQGSGWSLATQGLQPLLSQFRITAQWQSLAAVNTLVEALRSGRIAIAIVDAFWLNPTTYPLQRSWHAIVLTNAVFFEDGSFAGFAGLDSNFGGQELFWPYSAMAQAVSYSGAQSFLITDIAAPRFQHNDYYVLQADGQFRVVQRPRFLNIPWKRLP